MLPVLIPMLWVPLSVASVRANDYPIPVDPGLTVWARMEYPGIIEPAVALFLNGVPIGDYRLLQAYDQSVAGSGCFPETYADIIANMFFRGTYQKRDGSAASYGTSVAGTASFRPPMDELQYTPTVTRADLFTGVSERIEIGHSAEFEGQAEVISTRMFPDPTAGATDIGLTILFQALANIPLDGRSLGSDACRFATASSMFLNEAVYDANLVRFEDATGVIQTIPLTNMTPRGAHLLSAAAPIGSWFELVKAPGSTWHPDSPSVRVGILGASCPSGCLGIQGYLANSTSENDDSLTVWLEWIGAPPTILAGTSISIDLRVTSFGDPHLTAEQVASFVPVLLGIDTDPQHVDWADMNCDLQADGADIQFFANALLAP